MTRRALPLLVLLALATPALRAQDTDRSAEDGGIHVDGWMGEIDARAAEAGMALDDSRLSSEDGGLHVITGPATTYWNPANRASGNYTVSATFHELEYMSLNDHPHPYGIVIAGNDMGTEDRSYLYCAAYGNGTFIVRGFGPQPFQVNGRRPEANPAVNSAPGRNQPVTQEIAVTVTSDSVQCAINGTVVGTYPKSSVVGEGMLESTDGVYGVRFAHNTEATVTGLRMTRN